MNKNRIFTLIAASLFPALVVAAIAWASDSNKKHDMSGHDSHDMTKSETMNHDEMDHGKTAYNGNHEEAMHTSMVGNHHFTYDLIDMREKMKGMKDMPEMKATHHMMVYIKSHDGHALEKAMVGYYVTNPDGTTQKTMAMGMGDGFGADLDFSQKGTYGIKVKAVSEAGQLMDQFEYEVK